MRWAVETLQWEMSIYSYNNNNNSNINNSSNRIDSRAWHLRWLGVPHLMLLPREASKDTSLAKWTRTQARCCKSLRDLTIQLRSRMSTNHPSSSTSHRCRSKENLYLPYLRCKLRMIRCISNQTWVIKLMHPNFFKGSARLPLNSCWWTVHMQCSWRIFSNCRSRDKCNSPRIRIRTKAKIRIRKSRLKKFSKVLRFNP